MGMCAAGEGDKGFGGGTFALKRVFLQEGLDGAAAAVEVESYGSTEFGVLGARCGD